MSYAGISIFPPGLSDFSYIMKYKWKLYFIMFILILLTLVESLEVVSINISGASRIGCSSLPQNKDILK